MFEEKFAKPLFESLTDMPYNLQYLEGLMPMGDYMDGFDMVFHFHIGRSFCFMGVQMSTKQLIFQPPNHWEKR